MADTSNLSNFLKDVADSIRNKKQSQNTILPENFDTEINSIHTEPILQTKNIEVNQNGSTDILPDSGYDGLEKVSLTVDVPAPLPPTETINITENGTYNVQDYGTAEVEVPIPTPNMQSKDVTITTNGTTTIQADNNYDGLDEVKITTNIPSININDYEMSTITENPLPGSMTGALTLIKRLPPNFRINDNLTAGNLMFKYCKNLIEIPDGFNTENLTTATSMFQRCESLENVPVLDLSSITGKTLTSMFSGCLSLTDNSLNNIMQSLLSVTEAYTGVRTLKVIGLAEEQATTCQSLSNYQALINAGWTTGF